MLVNRPMDMARLEQWRDRDVIKVVTGVRRCGKSSLLALFRENLRRSCVPESTIISINLEDPEQFASMPDHLSLYREVVGRLTPETMNYVFIDEVQEIEHFERAVDGLHLRTDVDLYITGSNARLLSSELATLLSGRYVEIQMLPLSFSEYVNARQPDLTEDPLLRKAVTQQLFTDYQRLGSFPYSTTLQPDVELVRDYLLGILNTALLKDIVARHRIARADILSDVVAFVLDNVGNITSANRISDALTSRGRRTAPETIAGYLAAMAESFVVYEARRYDIKGKRLLENSAKYYAVDTGLRTALLGDRHRDTGHILENVVYLELRRRFRDVRVGSLGSTEVDFVAQSAAGPAYFQVCETVTTPTVLERELAPLRAIRDHYPRWMLTGDPGSVDHDGISQINVVDWLLASV